MMRQRTDVTLAVLAGGQGRRMGQAKAELRIGGKYILEYLLDQWRWPGPTLLVTAPNRQHPPGHERFDAEAIDPVAEQGPLRGVLTALEACPTQLLLATTVDMPRVNTGHLTWLIEQLEQHTDDLGLFVTRNSTDKGGVEPFPAALRKRAEAPIRRHFDAGDRSVRDLAGLHGFRVVAAPAAWDADVWTNLNRPEDLQNFQQ